MTLAKKKQFNKGYIFTTNAFANLPDGRFVTTANKEDFLQIAAGAIYKLNIKGQGSNNVYGDPLSYHDFAEWLPGWIPAPGTVDQKTLFPFQPTIGPNVASIGNNNKEYKEEYYLLQAGERPIIKGGVASKELDFWPLPNNSADYLNKYASGIAPALDKKSLEVARFCFACDALSMENFALGKPGYNFMATGETPMYHHSKDAPDVYTIRVSPQKAAFVDQITTSEEQPAIKMYINRTSTSIAYKTTAPDGWWNNPAAVDIVKKLTTSKDMAEVKSFYGLKENTALQDITKNFNLMQSAPKLATMLKSANIFNTKPDFNTFIDTKNKVGVKLVNKELLDFNSEFYAKAKNEFEIANFYKNSLMPDSQYKVTPASILYENITARKKRTIVLEVSDLIKAPQSSKAFAYNEISFEANFKDNSDYNKKQSLTTKASLSEKRSYFFDLLRDKLVNPGTINYYGGNKNLLYRTDIKGTTKYGRLEDFHPNSSKNPTDFSRFSYSKEAYKEALAVKKDSNLVKAKGNKSRSFSEIIDGNLSPYEVIGYKIIKSSKPVTDKDFVNSIISEIIILNDSSATNKIQLRYLDTQILMNKDYYYNVEQIVLISGTGLDYYLQYTKGGQSGPGKKYVGWGVVDKEMEIDTPSGIKKTAGLPMYDEKTFTPTGADELTGKTGIGYYLKFKAKALPLNIVLSAPLETISKTIGEVITEGEKGEKTTHTPPLSPILVAYTSRDLNNKVTLNVSAIAGSKTKAITTKLIKKYLGKAISGETSKLVFSDTVPVKVYRIYRTAEKPLSYEDFPKTPHISVAHEHPWAIDTIEPNKKYYYYATALSKANIESDESYVISVEMVDDHGMVFGLVKGVDFEDEAQKNIKMRKGTKRFRRLLRVSPAFLQSAPNPEKGKTGYVDMATNLYINGIDKSLFDSKGTTLEQAGLPSGYSIKPKFKFRIKSLKSKRKIDINILYTLETKGTTDVPPASAELVWGDTPVPPPMTTGHGVTGEEKKLMDQWEKENPQTFKKATPTPEQEKGEKKYWCNPGTPAGQPGGCDKGYKCIDTGLIKGTCEKIGKAPPADKPPAAAPKNLENCMIECNKLGSIPAVKSCEAGCKKSFAGQATGQGASKGASSAGAKEAQAADDAGKSEPLPWE